MLMAVGTFEMWFSAQWLGAYGLVHWECVTVWCVSWPNKKFLLDDLGQTSS